MSGEDPKGAGGGWLVFILLLIAGAFALALCVAPPARSQGANLYWQCVAPSSANPQGSFCPVSASYPLPMASAGTTISVTPLGYQQISPAVSTGLTVPSGAKLAMIEVDAAAGVSIRWRDDGTNPTSSVGFEVAPGSVLLYNGTLSAFQAIQTGASAKINVSYYK